MGRVGQLALLVLLGGCASAPSVSSELPDDAPEHGEINARMQAIHYVGTLTPDANERFLASFDSAAAKPRLLIISSPGGDINAGMDLGEWILEQRMDVEVSNVCLSSCANYVFVAGRAKRLRRDGVLMWHGSAWQEGFDRIADPHHPDFAEGFVRTRERERAFFERLGVDNVLTVCGHVQGLGLWKTVSALARRRPWIGWDYSLGDLVRLGVGGIRLVDGEWNWRDHRPVLKDRIRRVMLNDDFEFVAGRFHAPSDREGSC